MRKKILKVLALCLSFAFILTACQSNSGGGDKPATTGSSDKILIGGLAPLTGDVAIYGVTATNGAKLAFDEINKKGGILGKQVEFILEDEKGDPTEAVNAYNKLTGKGIVALLGDITSKPTVAVAELAKADNLPMVTPTGTQFDITTGRPNVFRVCFTDPFQGEILAQYAKDKLKATKVATMKNTSSDYSDGVAKAFAAKAKELGMEVVAEESYGKDDKDFKAQLTNIAAKNPDVLMIPDYYEVNALIAPQARDAGVKAAFIGPDGWDGVAKQVAESSYGTINGAVFSNHYSVDDKSEKVQNFIKAYKEKYNEDPSAFSALSYDGAYMLKEAIEKAGDTDKQKVVDALKNIDFTGVTGKLKFDANNNPIKSVSIIKIENGKYVLDEVVAPK